VRLALIVALLSLPRVLLPAFGMHFEAGPIVSRTGVGLREISRGPAFSATTSFVVPCAQTRLAPDQFGYVYLASIGRRRRYAIRVTEFGVQLNPPPHGGRPNSAQIYARELDRNDRVVTLGSSAHLRCDRRIRISLAPANPRAIAATFSGEAIAGRRAVRLSFALERFDEPVAVGCERCRVERIVALAVDDGRRPYRAGSWLGLDGAGKPSFVLDRLATLEGARSSDARPIATRIDATRVTVGIDERDAP
jgi:hypothetical protein